MKAGADVKADTGKGDAKPSASGSANGSASGSATGSDTKSSATTETKPSTNTATDTNRSGATASDTKTPAASATTGAAPSAGVAAAPPPEKRTQIISAIKTERVEPVTNVNFSIAVGTRVPSTVRYYPVPTRVVEVYPEWRGYYFILVNGKYVILRPQTYEIVYILDV
ncbi:MAG: DUF1236 domain-containing protein [Gammaproteobacteria bacterium]|nr:DUF1236 domain-containing protein [Gammaproteobacteria bacterium]